MAKSKKLLVDKKQTKQIGILQKEVDELKAARSVIESIKIENLTNLDSYVIKANRSYKEECTVITQLGDVHIDEIVNPNITNKLNSYNPEIAELRLERYFTRLIYMIRLQRRAGIKIDNLVLHLVGDFISGWIHDELIETNSMTPVRATLLVEQLLTRGIKTIAEMGDLVNIVIPCSIGNHSRTTKKNHFKNTFDTSFEAIIYQHLSDYFKNAGFTNVEFIISESPYIYYNIYGKINKFSHGNHFNYQGGIGGIEVGLNKWSYRENAVMPFDMAWIGHWHRYIVSPKVRINGAVIGYNEMSRAFGFTPEVPMMQFQLLDKKRGYTTNTPIILEDF
jgi:hypothetical protein